MIHQPMNTNDIIPKMSNNILISTPNNSVIKGVIQNVINNVARIIPVMVSITRFIMLFVLFLDTKIALLFLTTKYFHRIFKKIIIIFYKKMDSTSQRCPFQQHFNNNILPVYFFTKHNSLQEHISCNSITFS